MKSDNQHTLGPRYWRTVNVWHTFFHSWRPWEWEGSNDQTAWLPISREECTGEQIQSRQRTDIIDD